MSAIDNSYKMDGDVLLVILFLYTLFFRFNSRSFLCIFNSSCVFLHSLALLLHEGGYTSALLNGCSSTAAPPGLVVDPLGHRSALATVIWAMVAHYECFGS